MTCSKPRPGYVELRRRLHVACRLCCITVDVMLSGVWSELNPAPDPSAAGVSQGGVAWALTGSAVPSRVHGLIVGSK
jgi:hypothetical protein